MTSVTTSRIGPILSCSAPAPAARPSAGCYWKAPAGYGRTPAMRRSVRFSGAWRLLVLPLRRISYWRVALLFAAGFFNLAFLSMAQTLVQLQAHPPICAGGLIGLFNTSHNGLRAFSGVTVGVVGGLIGIHWSLAIGAMILLAVILALFAFVIPARGAGGGR